MFISLIKSSIGSTTARPFTSGKLRLLTSLALVTSLTACEIDKLSPTDNTTPPGENTSAVMLKGNVNDGPIVGASISITDSNGELLALTTSDDAASYAVTIPRNAAFPVIITATGGTDTVTGSPLSFPMMSVAMSADSNTANINPFSTLIVRTAKAMEGGLNRDNLETAKQYIVKDLNFGIDKRLASDPITASVTKQNIANIVKASVTFSEAIRRTHYSLLAMGESVTKEQLIDALAADMIDGYLDGIGETNANQLYSATINVVSGQVLIEALSNNLHVEGAWGTDLLDNAILVTMPDTATSTADVAITSEMIAQAKTSIGAAKTAAPNESLSTIAITLDNLPPESDLDNIRRLLPYSKSKDIKQAISKLAFLNNNELAIVNVHHKKENPAVSGDETVTLAWNPNTDSVLGYIVYYGPTPDTATNIATETSSTSVLLMRNSDLRLNLGDRICFRLKAYDNNLLSGFSGAACGRV